MSSSCVPPKSSCVVHDPDGQEDDRGNDTDSECGSLCTCTSSSMTSIATSVATSNPNGRQGRLTSSTSMPQLHPQQQRSLSLTTAAANAPETDSNPYFVVFVPPALLPNRSRSCGNCRGFDSIGAVIRAYLLTACEFCPFVAGFVFIYYAFYWWGIGPGFTAFLFMMGSQAFIRFLRAKGNAECANGGVQNHRDTAEEDSNDEEDNNNNEEVVAGDAPADVVNESPPSYETAVGKPPPYDLYHHLTPTQPRSSPPQQVKKQSLNDNNILTVPDFIQKAPRDSLDFCDEDDDVFLPSYQDALRLSFRSEKELETSDDHGDS